MKPKKFIIIGILIGFFIVFCVHTYVESQRNRIHFVVYGNNEVRINAYDDIVPENYFSIDQGKADQVNVTYQKNLYNQYQDMTITVHFHGVKASHTYTLALVDNNDPIVKVKEDAPSTLPYTLYAKDIDKYFSIYDMDQEEIPLPLQKDTTSMYHYGSNGYVLECRGEGVVEACEISEGTNRFSILAWDAHGNVTHKEYSFKGRETASLKDG